MQYVVNTAHCKYVVDGPVLLWWCSYNGWLAGYQTVFDTAKSKVTQNNFAFGYSKDDITVHTAVLVLLCVYICWLETLYSRLSQPPLQLLPRFIQHLSVTIVIWLRLWTQPCAAARASVLHNFILSVTRLSVVKMSEPVVSYIMLKFKKGQS